VAGDIAGAVRYRPVATADAVGDPMVMMLTPSTSASTTRVTLDLCISGV